MKGKRVRVDVTQEDIDTGRPYSPGRCAFALALKRTLNVGHVAVGIRQATTGVINEKRTFLTSQRAIRFIRAFDRGKPVEPSTFYLTEVTDEHSA